MCAVLEPVARLPRPPAWAVLVVALWLGVVAAATALKAGRSGAPPLCLFRRVTDVPCPTCGTTRAALAVLDGRFLDALRLNPLMCAIAFGVGAWLVVRLVSGRRVALVAAGWWRGAAWGVAVVAVVVNWVWVVMSQG